MTSLSKESQYIYDLVIVYPDELLRWVKKFERRISKHWNLPDIFLFDRDNEPGGNISDEWVRAITHTRKVLLFASKGMDDNEWAQFATYLAQNCSPSGHNPKLAIVKFHDCKILKSFQIYNIIDYSTESGKAYFWHKVYQHCTGIKVKRNEVVPGTTEDSWASSEYVETELKRPVGVSTATQCEKEDRSGEGEEDDEDEDSDGDEDSATESTHSNPPDNDALSHDPTVDDAPAPDPPAQNAPAQQNDFLNGASVSDILLTLIISVIVFRFLFL